MAGIDSLLDPKRGDAATAVVHGDERLDHHALVRRVEALARALDAAPGERVAVMGDNSAGLVAALFATWRRQAVAVPLSGRARSYELERALSDSQAVDLVAVDPHGRLSAGGLFEAAPTLRRCVWLDDGGRFVHAVERASHASTDSAPLDPAIAAILYTSGTTGKPKGALVTHSSELAAADSCAALLGLEPGERAIFVVPIAHAFGLIALLSTIASGGCAVMVRGGLAPAPVLEAAGATGATVLHGSPSLFAALVKGDPDRLRTLRTGLVAGALCPPEVLQRLDACGVRILNLFGMTEIGAASACRPDDPPAIRYETVGRALAGYELRVVDGEVQVRSEHLTPGYHGRPGATAEAFDGDWFRTGDLGSLDPDGNLAISGRRKELVNVAGFNVFPGEIEGILTTHPDVAQAAVAGVPNERMGEVLRAWVVLRPGADVAPVELVRFARERIAGYKVPYRIEILDELPLLASGKPDRAALARGSAEVAHAVR